MLAGTSGSFTNDPVIGVTYYYASGPIFPADEALVFDGTTLTIKIASAQSGFWYTLYSLDDLLEETWTKIESLQATGSELTFTMDLGTPPPPRLFFKVVATPEKP
jgi:putative alpha-1,2-mannosidase